VHARVMIASLRLPAPSIPRRLTCLVAVGATQIAMPVRAMVRERLTVPASLRSTGTIRAMGKSQGTIAPRIIPAAGIFPAHCRLPVAGTHWWG
jgi:hypothetical protein